jgi:hypothetical protein
MALVLKLMHDRVGLYMWDDFKQEIKFLGIQIPPAFVRDLREMVVPMKP